MRPQGPPREEGPGDEVVMTLSEGLETRRTGTSVKNKAAILNKEKMRRTGIHGYKVCNDTVLIRKHCALQTIPFFYVIMGTFSPEDF